MFRYNMNNFQILEENNSKLSFWTQVRNLRFQVLFAILTVICFVVTWSVLAADSNAQWKAIQDLNHRLSHDNESPMKNKSNAFGQSCRDIYNNGIKTSGYYLINPDGRGHYHLEVLCENMREGSSHIRTVVMPDDPQKRLKDFTRTFWANDTKSISEFPLDYGADFDALKTLVENSGYCHQKLSFKCTGISIDKENISSAFIHSGSQRYNFPDQIWKARNCLCDDYISLNCTCDTCDSDSDFHGTYEKEFKFQDNLPITALGMWRNPMVTKSGTGYLKFDVGPLICEGKNELQFL